jgi:glucose/arabinose dehydrogenase
MKRAVTLLALCLLASGPGIQAEAPYGLTIRHPVGPFLNQQMPSFQPETGDWTPVNAFPNLTFPDPIGMVSHPRANLMYVYTRQGEIYSFPNDPGVRQKRLFLRISAQTQGWDDCGLLGMAFHPEFGMSGSTNRDFVYVYYRYSEHPTEGPERPPRQTPAYNRLSRFTLADGDQTVDPDSELVLSNQYDRDLWHNGGAMYCHPDDGFLYLSLGDEGGINAEYDNDQRIDHGLFSGVIRIDVDQNPQTSHPIRRQPEDLLRRTQSYTAHYFIPNDNPFVNPAGTVLEEFWCIGLRSPHRMTYDPETDSIWLGDVGPDRREEINLIEKGGNYEWAYREGRDLTGPRTRPAQPMGKEISPLHDYPHENGDNCIIGGYVTGENGLRIGWADNISSGTTAAVESGRWHGLNITTTDSMRSCGWNGPAPVRCGK